MSISESAGITATHRLLIDEPSWSSLLSVLAEEYDADYCNSALLSAIHEANRDAYFTIYESHAVARVLSAISTKEVAVVLIPVTSSASFNADEAGNQLTLGNLPKGFEAVFEGRQADADGLFKWVDDLTGAGVVVPGPGVVPLEVGTTSAWTTWEHITFHGGVARLPYNSSDVFLFVRVNPRLSLSI